MGNATNVQLAQNWARQRGFINVLVQNIVQLAINVGIGINIHL